MDASLPTSHHRRAQSASFRGQLHDIPTLQDQYRVLIRRLCITTCFWVLLAVVIGLTSWFVVHSKNSYDDFLANNTRNKAEAETLLKEKCTGIAVDSKPSSLSDATAPGSLQLQWHQIHHEQRQALTVWCANVTTHANIHVVFLSVEQTVAHMLHHLNVLEWFGCSAERQQQCHYALWSSVHFIGNVRDVQLRTWTTWSLVAFMALTAVWLVSARGPSSVHGTRGVWLVPMWQQWAGWITILACIIGIVVVQCAQSMSFWVLWVWFVAYWTSIPGFLGPFLSIIALVKNGCDRQRSNQLAENLKSSQLQSSTNLDAMWQSTVMQSSSLAAYADIGIRDENSAFDHQTQQSSARAVAETNRRYDTPLPYSEEGKKRV